MRTLDLISEMFLQMEWADSLVWSAVRRSSAASEDRDVRDRLYHLHLVQRAFLHIWRNETLKFEGTESLAGEELERWAREYHANVRSFVAGLTESDLDRVIVLPWAAHVTRLVGHEPANPSLGETLVQVASHSMYHRGQVNARLRQLGVEPPLVDFIAWVWIGKPSAVWPAVAVA